MNIPKLCADNLRSFLENKFSIKLKASHAHELVAAFFGYKSNAALRADKITNIENLFNADIIVMTSESCIDLRRKELQGLPQELPDSYTLGESVYVPLFSQWKSLYPPFRSFEKLAKFIFENDDTIQYAFKFHRNLPKHHIFEEKVVKNDKILIVQHCDEISSDKFVTFGKTTIRLPRLAGFIGYGRAQVSIELHTGQERQIFKRNMNLNKK